MGTYAEEVYVEHSTFDHRGAWYGMLTIDEDGTCTVHADDGDPGSPVLSAPASQVQYNKVRLFTYPVPSSTATVDLAFPEGKRITVDFARAWMRKQKLFHRIASGPTGVALKHGKESRGAFIAALESSGGAGAEW